MQVYFASEETLDNLQKGVRKKTILQQTSVHLMFRSCVHAANAA